MAPLRAAAFVCALIHTMAPLRAAAFVCAPSGVRDTISLRSTRLVAPQYHRRVAAVDPVTMSLADRSTAAQVDPLSTAPVQHVASSQEYHQLLALNPDKLVVFKWHAPYCRACKAMDLKFRRLALERRDVVFADINVARAVDLKRAHGVAVIPAIHMHAGHLGQVEAFACGPSSAPLLRARVDRYADVSAYVACAQDSLAAKLAAFSAGVAGRLAIPAEPLPPPRQQQQRSAPQQQQQQRAERRSLENLAAMVS
ncbi:hypothetical protein JKP88DRAFT_267418 [Tribonema minus]|uniref:Thioredoxin domain-containing protein n=1 Tax=Tribonema minus TaxID=303371 RepID=A0A836CK13_9STRA|nr:hypothetical protein JKP88DRAFT_267418 [Tribonema minus]